MMLLGAEAVTAKYPHFSDVRSTSGRFPSGIGQSSSQGCFWQVAQLDIVGCNQSTSAPTNQGNSPM